MQGRQNTHIKIHKTVYKFKSIGGSVVPYLDGVVVLLEGDSGEVPVWVGKSRGRTPKGRGTTTLKFLQCMCRSVASTGKL